MANDMGEDEVDQVFRGVSMALMNDEGRLKRVHDSTVALEVCPRQYEAQIRVVKGWLNISARGVRCTCTAVSVTCSFVMYRVLLLNT